MNAQFRLALVLACVLLCGALNAVSYSFDLLDRAQKGDAQAQFELGVCYDFGYGVYKNEVEAVVWYYLAAVLGHVEAQYFLGTCYDDGRGVDPDPKEAYSWYKRAAQKGHPGAQFNLGVSYFNGEGVARNMVEAYAWLLISATYGDPDAIKALPEVAASLTTEQQAQAQSKATLWVREQAPYQPEAQTQAQPGEEEESPGRILILQFAGAYDFPLSASALSALQSASNITLQDGSALLRHDNQINLTQNELARINLKRDGSIALNYEPAASLSPARLKKALRDLQDQQAKLHLQDASLQPLGFMIAAEDEMQTAEIVRLLKLLRELGADTILVRRAGSDPIQPAPAP